MTFIRILAVRLIAAAAVVFTVVTVVFFVSRVIGNPVSYLAPVDATPEEIARIEQAYGLNEPILVQYRDFVLDVARLDLGRSFRTGQPAVSEVRARVGKTLQLGTLALFFSLALGIPLGILAAVR